MICPKPFRGLLIDGFEIFWTNAGIFCWRTRHPLMTWSGRILAIFDRSTTLSAGMLYRCFTSKNLHQKMLINCYNLPNLRWKLHISGNHQLDQLIPSSCTLVNPQRGLQNHRKWKLFGQLQLCDSHSHLCLQTPSGIVWPQVQEGETKSANRDNWSIILLVLGRGMREWTDFFMVQWIGSFPPVKHQQFAIMLKNSSLPAWDNPLLKAYGTWMANDGGVCQFPTNQSVFQNPQPSDRFSWGCTVLGRPETNPRV